MIALVILLHAMSASSWYMSNARIGSALADEIFVEPFLCDSLELPEEVELWLFAGIAPFRIQQTLGHLKNQRGLPHVVQVFKAQIDAFADDAGVPSDGRTDQIGSQFQHGVRCELGFEPFLGKFDPVALHSRECDLQVIALWTHRLDLNRFSRRLRRSDNWLCGEVERNSKNVGIFDVEHALIWAVFIDLIRLAAKGSADNLFAEKLRAESPNTQHVRHGVGVPTFREH